MNTYLFQALVALGVNELLAQQAASHKNSNPVEYYKLLMQNNINAEKLSNLDRRLEYVDKKFERKLDNLIDKIDKLESKFEKKRNKRDAKIENFDSIRAKTRLHFIVTAAVIFLSILASSIANILFG